MIIALLIGFVILIFAGISVVVAIAVITALGMAIRGDVNLAVLAQSLTGRMGSASLAAIPLFLLMGSLMNASGVTSRILDLAQNLVGHFRGGLAQVNVASSLFMGGLSGSSSADAALTTKILVPRMVEKGYPADFSGAVTAVASTIAIILPPSVAMIIYGSLADVSVGALFITGIVPGLMLGCLLIASVYIVARKRRYLPAARRESLGVVFRSLIRALPALALPVIIIGGIRLGVFTPVEAAAVGVMYTLFLGFVVYRELSLRELPNVLISSGVSTGIVMIIVGISAPLTFLITIEHLPQRIAEFVGNVSESPLVFLLIVNLSILVLGMVIDSVALIILITPILAPVASLMGVDPLHFAIVIIVNILVGTLTPPFGQMVYVVSAIGEIPAEGVFRQVFVFYPALLILLIVVTYFPEIYLWVPSVLGG
ncbi:TRAP transporter large permease [Nesterenkonia muleiensis]|uniref:TRAP transporter large permease n=1 Tax=Nesterenkonia muleiensis TaxID=2282648 RepID=UPI000E721C89|nr:TRAP transporter large permease [Nesterenkonia muleiensis]